MPSINNTPVEDRYYSDNTEEETSTPPEQALPIKKIVAGLLILFAIFIILILAVNLLSQTNNPLFFLNEGKSFKQTVTVSKDSQMIESFSSDGNALELKGNPLDQIRGKITSPSLSGGKKSGKITITSKGGRITILNSGEGFFIDENGNLTFTIDPSDLLDLDEYYDENTGEYVFPPDFDYETTFEFVIVDEETGEETVIVAPVNFIFSNQNSTSCISLNRSFINESTHYGSLPVSVSLNVVCEAYSDLTSFVNWESERMGNVEVILGNYNYASVLTDYNKFLLSVPTTGNYPFRIIFTPFKEAVGKKAFFSVNFLLNGINSKIDFEVPIDNLEQCVQITSDNLLLSKDSESISFKVDVSSCYSEKITVSLCDNDLSCAGGTEGGINLSQYSFVLSPKGNSSKLINIKKDSIAGAYGIPVYARITGASKVLVDEKTVIVEPFNGETIYPEKYILSMLGTGKDSVLVRNNDLAEDVEVKTSICNVYKSSMGIKAGASSSSYNIQSLFGESWWRALASDREKYSGSGKYQAALFSLIGTLEKKRIETQNESYAKNVSIKQSYLMSADLLNKVTLAIEDTDGMLTFLKNVDDKIKNANDYAETDMASQIVSLTTGATTIFTSATFLSADVTAASTAVDAAAATGLACPASEAGTTTAVASMKKAMAASSSILGYSSTVLGLATSTYGIYTGMNDMTKNVEEINSASALSNTKKAIEKLNAAKEEAKITLAFAELMMISASIDTFYSISKDDLTAKDYAEDVLVHAQNVFDLLTEAQEYLTTAMDDITIGLPDTQSNTAAIISIVASVASLVTQIPAMEANASEVISEIDIASTAMISAVGLASAACDVPATSTVCCPFLAPGATAKGKLVATNLTGLSTLASVTSYASLLNTVYSLVRTYQGYTDNYVEDYAKASTKMSDLIPKINTAKLAAKDLVEFLPTTISAASWLGEQSKKTSGVADYTSEEYGEDGTYNKKRLNGIIGTVLANAFVNGAYQGGVYSKESTFSNGLGFSSKEVFDENKTKISFADESDWKEDCANMVALTLPDYKINLLTDAQRPVLSAQGIVALWDFSDPKVYGVYEQQTVDLTFVSSGLKKNIYGIVEFPLVKHIHTNPTETAENFGPFDVPDTAETLSYKYHMKFNTIPQKSNNYVKPVGDNSCSVGILRGETGNTKSLPRVVLSWDWNSVIPATGLEMRNNSNYTRKINSAVIGTGSNQEPFIDSSQLSILISKKLGSLESYLEIVQSNCPVNPVGEILSEIAPDINELNQLNTYTSQDDVVQKCYLPLSTKEYDGKPAFYYYLPATLNNSLDSDSFNSPNDIEKISTRDEFLNLVDFNAYLIRDGYGIDFQSDFVVSYSSKVFATAYSFLNNQTGLKNYFFNSDRFFFSSRANSMTSKREWVLPDAGKYRIRAVIDFDKTPNLFVASSPSAKIIISIELIEPVNNDYSPLYYTPIDGFTGLTSNNNRIGYGSSLVGGYDLDVVKSQGALISTMQKNSLVKLNFVKSSDFFLLNALPSMRSKIFDYSLSPTLDDSSSIIFSPTLATPLLFEIKETQGIRTMLNYSILRDTTKLSSPINSLFILSKLNGCYDYTGKSESSFLNNGPDYGNEKVFGLLLPVSEKDGVNFVKTVAYAPIQDNYYIEKPASGVIYSPSSLGSTSSNILLSGVLGMKSNYSQANDTVDSLGKIMDGVETGSICVASLGTREVFFWPEEEMFEEKYVGKEFADKQVSAMNSCIKQAN